MIVEGLGELIVLPLILVEGALPIALVDARRERHALRREITVEQRFPADLIAGGGTAEHDSQEREEGHVGSFEGYERRWLGIGTHSDPPRNAPFDTPWRMKKTLIVGASRGIGLALVKARSKL
ncbi:MAG: hypothetical protein AAFU79_36745, partial [Myxococcota bacterium]